MMLLATVLNNEPLIRKAQTLDCTGIIQQHGAYTYLNIDDAYIHELYELLSDNVKARKPDYFSASKNSVGAHITVAYNEENIVLHPDDIGQTHSFSITSFSRVVFGTKEYFVLMVSSPSLDQLRTKYGLPEKPCYKNTPIDFHITVAVLV